ncbi:unnamed protein product [Brassicogethes aeneus]|uniref:THAP-type domain-containing protein n=1 Tax=Brassicogethes aeneus TaxID=1431903 RepID=A0A9P0FIU6_BRAAE|nr:unnamed protein product [Brassicogethes aeneus]
MVRQCQVCGKVDATNPELSFHRFPLNPERRNLWFSLLEFTQNKRIPKTADVCSQHFDPNDIYIRSNGFKYLKADANPLPASPLFEPNSSSSESLESILNENPKSLEVQSTSSAEPYSDADGSPNKLLEKITLGVEVSKTSGKVYQGAPYDETNEQETRIATHSDDFDLNIVPYCKPGTSQPKDGQKVEFKKYQSYTTSTASETEEQILSMLKSNPSEVPESLVGPDSVFRGKLALVNVPKKRKRDAYVGDLSSDDFDSPKKRRRKIAFIKKVVEEKRKKVHGLQTTVRRLRKRITSLKSLLDLFKKKLFISENSESMIKASLPDQLGEIFERFLKGPSKQKYTPALRCFALTLSFYSTRAYNFLRTTFNRSLPHLATISKWYRSVDGSPGFTKEALAALKSKQNDSPVPLLCNLVMDEMSIRKQVEWTGNKFVGYVDVGTRLESDSLPKAREALVFMLVCLNGSWKLPIGYFLLDGLGASEKAELVKKCLQFIAESGVIVTSLTFDGAPTNLSMAEKLGANFSDPKNLKTDFPHPTLNYAIFIYLDACHMVKLVRNCFGSQEGLKDNNNEDVKWSFVEKLVEKQHLEGLHAGNKLRMRHIKYQREKMKVRLATQTLSKSASDAINFLRENIQDPDFANSEATSAFLLKFNDLFDILNSRNRLSKYFYKKPFSPATYDTFISHLNNMKEYILSLTLRSVPIVKSIRKTGFLGLLICIESIIKMYNIYVVEKKYLKYILTYKLSQDHLELFFGAIRSRGGYNNNPNAKQFEAAYKRLLVRSQISAPNTGNTLNLESITILTCGSGRLQKDEVKENGGYEKLLESLQNEIEKEGYLISEGWDLTLYSKDIVAYISGFVVRGIKKCVDCPTCLALLVTEESISELQKKKTYGRLVKASKLVIETCRAGEKFFRFFHKTTNIFNQKIENLLQILITKSLQFIPSSVYDDFGDHFYDSHILLDDHVSNLLKSILKIYFNLRIHHLGKQEEEVLKINRLRSINTKTVLFRNE